MKTMVATTNTPAHYWYCGLRSLDLGLSAATTLGAMSAASDSPDTRVTHETNINAAVAAASNHHLDAIFTATGAPGAFVAFNQVFYRLIVT